MAYTLNLEERWASEFLIWLSDPGYMSKKLGGAYLPKRIGNAIEFNPMQVKTRLRFENYDGTGRKARLGIEMSVGEESDGKQLTITRVHRLGSSAVQGVFDEKTVDSIFDKFLIPSLRQFLKTYQQN